MEMARRQSVKAQRRFLASWIRTAKLTALCIELENLPPDYTVEFQMESLLNHEG